MPVGTCEREFAVAALADGIELTRARVSWLNRRGHLGLPEQAAPAVGYLASIFEALGGLPEVQAAKGLTSLPGDFYHSKSGTFIEIDESQHFTSFHLLTFGLYPADLALGFELDRYRALCVELAPKSDKYRRSKAALGFGEGGRQRQRAYNDALRDIVTPAMEYPPVVRVAAPEADGALAYQRVRSRMLGLTP